MAALLAAAAGLAASALPARAATFNVPAGNVPALAAAIVDANDHADCSNRIVLAAGTWTLTAPWTGAYAQTRTGLPVVRLDQPACERSRELVIEGAGADFTVIQRDAGAPRFRLMSVTGVFEKSGGVKLVNLSLRGGDLLPANAGELYGNGAAVRSDSANLWLEGVAITGHRATRGGAIEIGPAWLDIRRSRLEGNSAAHEGGAVYGWGSFDIRQSSLSNNTAGAVPVSEPSHQGGGAMWWQLLGPGHIEESTLSNNRATHQQRDGGALHITSNDLNIVRSELRGNRASGRGGAIASDGPVSLASTTLSGNAAAVRGGAVFGAALALSHATVAMNLAPAGDAAIVAPALTARNSLLAATLGPSGTGVGANCSADTASTSERWNLDSDGSCHFAAVGDLSGFDPATVIDLVPRNWGGLTLAHAPLPGGLAIDRIQEAGPCHHMFTDQRGALERQDGDGDGAARCDVGAMEHQPALLTLKAAADTTVRTDLILRRNDNYGLQDTLLAGSGSVGDGKPPGAPDAMRALVRFDLSAVAGVKLTGATLEASLHSFDGGPAASLMTLQAHRIAAGVPAWVEGNGFEGLKPLGAPANLSDPDGAFGVAWAGAGSNPDPHAANNTTQPAFDPAPLAVQPIAREPAVYPVTAIGSTLRWHVTAAAQQWIDIKASNAGLVLVAPSTDGGFRGARLGSREGELYKLPGWVSGPRLALSWTMGTIPGDFTGGGCIDKRDLDLLMVVARGQAVASPALRARMDLNGDGRVDVIDARQLALMFTYPLGVPC